MNNLGLPLPEKIMEALQTNITATVDSAIHFPTISQLNQIHQLGPNLVHHLVSPATGRSSDKDRRAEFVRLFGSMLSDDETTSLLAENPVLLDVRLENECAEKELGTIPGSINIPLPQLPKVTNPYCPIKNLSHTPPPSFLCRHQRVHELDTYKTHPIICVCRAGVRSTTAAALLRGLGFASVFNLKGGMLAWKAQYGH